jgi:hypothetical protein
VEEWKIQAECADENRLNDVEVMDIYNTDIERRRCHSSFISIFKTPDAQSLAPSGADLQAGLIEKEQKTHRSKGVTSWLATGLKIEEAQ